MLLTLHVPPTFLVLFFFFKEILFQSQNISSFNVQENAHLQSVTPEKNKSGK